MNNLTMRLRGEGGTVDIPEIMHEAADEIEQLRLRVARMSHGLSMALLKAENAKQKARIARDNADHAVQYAIDAETAIIGAMPTSDQTLAGGERDT